MVDHFLHASKLPRQPDPENERVLKDLRRTSWVGKLLKEFGERALVGQEGDDG